MFSEYVFKQARIIKVTPQTQTPEELANVFNYRQEALLLINQISSRSHFVRLNPKRLDFDRSWVDGIHSMNLE